MVSTKCQKIEVKEPIFPMEIQGLVHPINKGSYCLREEIMTSLLNSINHAIFVINFNMKVVYLNKVAEHVTGYAYEQAIGKTCGEVFCSTVGFDRNNFSNCNVLDIIRNRGTKVWKGMINDKEGKIIPVFCTASTLFNQDNYPNGVVVTFTDMTALEQSRGKQAELTLEAVVGKSRKMRELYYFVRSISDSLSNVLIRGETGVGKGLIAKLIHFYSINRNGPFIHVNCSAIPESLLESELFGHTKGAFTGAINDRKGRFELANNGTLFLDEIGDLSLAMQTKLLRVVEDKKFEKLGSNTPIESNVRIIAATNKNIEEAVLKGTFRADLYYRLNIIPIFIPPLRDRMEDLPLLINHFIDKLNNQYNKDPKIRSVSCYAFDVLSKYSWPGNIRELENVLEYAFIHCKDSQLDTQHLPINLLGVKIEKINNKFMKGVSAELVEKQRLTEALDKCRWNRKNTAKFLNLSRPTLWRKIKKYQLLSQGPIN